MFHGMESWKPVAKSPESIAPLAKESLYVRKPVITFEELEQLLPGDELMPELVDELKKQAFEYALTIVRFKEILAAQSDGSVDASEMGNIDSVRRSSHDAFIAVTNAMLRHLNKNNCSQEWMKNFDPSNRPVYTKFAISLALSELSFDEDREEAEVGIDKN